MFVVSLRLEGSQILATNLSLGGARAIDVDGIGIVAIGSSGLLQLYSTNNEDIKESKILDSTYQYNQVVLANNTFIVGGYNKTSSIVQSVDRSTFKLKGSPVKSEGNGSEY